MNHGRPLHRRWPPEPAELRAEGCSDKEAKIALARKIAAICLALFKNNDNYSDDFDTEQARRTEARKTLNLEKEA